MKKKEECAICFEQKVNKNLSKFCNHKSSTCLNCEKKAIENLIINKGVCKFVCQYPKCETIFEYQDYYPHLSKRHQETVDQLLLKEVIESDESFRYCASPKGCAAGQFINNWKSLQGYYTCFACKIELCFKHKIPYHFGFTCEEFDQELAANIDLSSDYTILQSTKLCPSCKNPIEKSQGCFRMICCRYGTHGCQDNITLYGKCNHGGQNFCGQIFCWDCMGKISYEKGKEKRNCKAECPQYNFNN